MRGGGREPGRAPAGPDRPDPLSVPSHPFSGFDRVPKAAVAAVLTGTHTAGISTAGPRPGHP